MLFSLTSSSSRAEKFLRKRCLKTSLRDFLFFPRTAAGKTHGKGKTTVEKFQLLT